MLRLMGNLPKLIWGIVTRLFRSRVALEAENVTLRHQLNVLRRKAPKRFGFNNFDRFVFTCLYRIAPDVLNALVIVKPDGYPLAPGRVSPVLAMEVALSGRQTEGPTRNPSIDPRYEPRQPAVGRAPDPRRSPYLGFGLL